MANLYASGTFYNEIESTVNDIFNTPQKKRCRDCIYLVEGDNKEWICDDCGKDIHDISDEECSANQKW